MKHRKDITKRINFLNTLIGKNCKVIEIISITKLSPRKVEYNLSIINSKGILLEDRYSWYTYDWNTKKLELER